MDGFFGLTAEVDGIKCCLASFVSLAPAFSSFADSFWRFLRRSLNDTFRLERVKPVSVEDVGVAFALSVGDVGLILVFLESDP